MSITYSTRLLCTRLSVAALLCYSTRSRLVTRPLCAPATISRIQRTGVPSAQGAGTHARQDDILRSEPPAQGPWAIHHGSLRHARIHAPQMCTSRATETAEAAFQQPSSSTIEEVALPTSRTEEALWPFPSRHPGHGIARRASCIQCPMRHGQQPPPSKAYRSNRVESSRVKSSRVGSSRGPTQIKSSRGMLAARGGQSGARAPSNPCGGWQTAIGGRHESTLALFRPARMRRR